MAEEIERLFFTQLGLSPKAQTIVNYRFVWEDVAEGMEYMISPAYYNQSMEGIGSDLRVEKSVTARKYLADVYSEFQKMKEKDASNQ